MRALVFAAILQAAALAQGTRGELRIQVLDPSGAGIARAEIELDFADGTRRALIADADGQAFVRDLAPGECRLTAKRDGFKPSSSTTEVRPSETVTAVLALSVAEARTTIEVDGASEEHPPAGAAYSIGERQIDEHAGAQPRRLLADLVSAQPGWLYEDGGVLHPRASEYDVQFVVDGLQVTEKQAPGAAFSFDESGVTSMNVLTSGYPAEYGRKLGGVVEVTSAQAGAQGLHGKVGFSAGSYSQGSAGLTLDFGSGGQYFSMDAQGGKSDRYLDPPVLANFTNCGSSSDFALSYSRDLTAKDRLRLTVLRTDVGFEIPNQLTQQIADQRQDQRHRETGGSASYQRVLSAAVLWQTRASFRDLGMQLWSNEFATPVWVWQDRGYRQLYVSTALSGHRGRHDWKAGTDAILGSVQEALAYRIADPTQFDPGIAPTYRFADRRQDREQAAFVQDRIAFGNWAISAGLRFDSYRLAVNESGWSPRLAISKYFPAAGVTLHASYDRVFQTPAVENILLASLAHTDALASSAFHLPLRSARGNFYEAGVSKSIFRKARFSANVFRRNSRNAADDEPLLNTGVSFPIAFARAMVHGLEGKFEFADWKRLSGFLTYGNETGFGYGPVTGGLFLGGESLAAQRFALSQDQRNTAHALARYQISRACWIAVPASWGSGLPVEADASDYEMLLAQYGEPVTQRVNLARGRVRPNLSIDAAAGYELRRRDSVVTVQLQMTNLLNRVNVINFAGLFSGTTIAMTRSARMSITFGF